MENCIFCEKLKGNIVEEFRYWYTVMDEYPVSVGHMLIICKRHIGTFFEITKEEHEELYEVIKSCKEIIDGYEPKPDGYNIGINNGVASGQSIPHLHIHIIPRYNGDVENPRGGVRGVIPSKQNY